jgi:uncharacterized membrane protein
MVNLARVLRHLFTPAWRTRHAFPPHALRAIEEAIRASESTHSGEIRFAIEAALNTVPLLRGQTARERAIEVFANLRVWDTEGNNGVLIYVLLAEHDVEIVADRGVNARVAHAEWEAICRRMEVGFHAGQFGAGALAGIGAVGDLLARHYPCRPDGQNELPDKPVLLR